MAAPVYRYLAYNAVGNTPIAELPLQGVTWDQKLNDVGPFTASLPVDDPKAVFDPIAATNPESVIIYVERNGVLMDGYLIETRRRSLASSSILIGCNSIAAFLKARLSGNLWTTSGGVATNGAYSGDPLVAARTLVSLLATTAAGYDLGITVGTETSGSSVSIAGIDWTECRTAFDVLGMLAKAGTPVSGTAQVGFDWSIDVAWNGSVPARYLRLWYPRRGRPTSTSGIVFDAQSNLFGFVSSEDGTRMANSVLCSGVSDAISNTALISQAATVNGYPLRERGVTGLKDVSNQSHLDARAQAELAATKVPVEIPSLIVNGALDPQVGSYVVGDDVRVIVPVSRMFPVGVDAYYRIIALSVVPSDDGPETVTLTVNPA
jgi:hypothetical protein